MDEKISSIINYYEGRLSKKASKKFEEDLLKDHQLHEDYLLFRRINKYMQAKLDLEDAIADPDLNKVEPAVKDILKEFKFEAEGNTGIRSFISGSLDQSGKELKDEFEQIKVEVHEQNINDTGGWIKDWITTHPEYDKSRNAEKIRNFIENTGASVKTTVTGRDDVKIVPLFSTYKKVLAAAIFIAGIIIVKSLFVQENPEILYENYYEPFKAISPVTRGENENKTDEYRKGIEEYKRGKYSEAALIFENLLKQDSTSAPYNFFLGITTLAEGNSKKAESYLSRAATGSGEFYTEAQWYLGLASLKSGDKAKAANIFQNLSDSNIFYRKRADKLLRRLK